MVERNDDWFSEVQREYRTPFPTFRSSLRGTARGGIREDQEEEDLDFLDYVGDTLAAPFRGVEGAIQGVYGLADTIFGDILPDYDEKLLGESETGLGSFIQGVSQFAAGFVPVGGWLSHGAKLGKLGKIGPKALTKKRIDALDRLAAQGVDGASRKAFLGRLGHGALAGAITDFTVFDGHEARLSNLIQEVPGLSHPIFEFLAADEDDHEITGRFKAAIEGLGLGVMLDSLFLSVKRYRAMKKAKDEGKTPAEVEQAGEDAVPTETLNEAYDDGGRSLSDQEELAANGTGREPETLLDLDDDVAGDVRLGGASIHRVTDFPHTPEWQVADPNTRMPDGPDPDHLYHITTRERAQKIIDEGELRPGETQSMDEGFYSAYSKDKVFLTEKGGVPFWADRVEQHLSSRFDEPDAGWDLVVLKIKRSDAPDLKIDAEGTRDAKSGKSYYSARPIELSPDNVRLGDDTLPTRNLSEVDEVLDDLPVPEGATDTTLTPAKPWLDRRKRGVKKGIIERLAREVSHGKLDHQSASFASDLIERLTQQGDLPDIALSISDLAEGIAGDWSAFQQIMTLSAKVVRGGDVERTFTHELWHALTRYVDPSDLKAMRRDLHKARRAYAKKYGLNHDDIFVSDDPFYALLTHARENKVEKAEWYRLVNEDEWLAENMADSTLSWLDLEDGTKTIIGNMRYVMKKILTSIKSVFGRGTYDRVARGFLEGTYGQKVRGVRKGGKLKAGLGHTGGVLARDIDPSKVELMSRASAVEAIRNKIPKSVHSGWFRNGDRNYKPRLVKAINSDPEVRDAGLSIMHDQYQTVTGTQVPFDEFLDTPITLYRGGPGTPDEAFTSYTLDKEIAEKFGEVTEITATPRETLGMYQTIAETEVLVPNNRTLRDIDPSAIDDDLARMPFAKLKEEAAKHPGIEIPKEGSAKNKVLKKQLAERIQAARNAAAEGATPEAAAGAAVRSVDDAAGATAAREVEEPEAFSIDDDADVIFESTGASREMLDDPQALLSHMEEVVGQASRTLDEGIDPKVNPRNMTKDELLEAYLDSTDLNLSRWEGGRGVLALVRSMELMDRALNKLRPESSPQKMADLAQKDAETLTDLLSVTREENWVRDITRFAEKDLDGFAALHSRIRVYRIVVQKAQKDWVNAYGKEFANIESLKNNPELVLKMWQDHNTNAELLRIVKGLSSETGRGLRGLALNVGDLSTATVKENTQKLRHLGGTPAKVGETGAAPGVVDAGAGIKDARRELEALGGINAVIKKMERAYNASKSSSAAYNRMVSENFRRKTLDVLTEYWMNAILSGPLTMAANGISGVLTSLYGPMEAMMGASYNRMFGADKEAAAEALHDASRELFEVISGFFDKSIWSAARDVWANEAPTLTRHTKFEELGQRQAIKGETFGLEADSGVGQMLDWTGKNIIRQPSRILASTDEFFKQINYRAKVKSQLFREGINRGVPTEELGEWVAKSLEEIVENGSALTWQKLYSKALAEADAKGLTGEERRVFAQNHVREQFDPADGNLKQRFLEISEEGVEAAELRTFTNPLDYDGIGNKIQNMVTAHPMLRFITPFIRTPLNIASYAGDRMLGAPLGQFRRLANKTFRGDLQRLEGSRNKYIQDMLSGDPNKVAEARGRLVTGFGALAVLHHFVENGTITGRAPSDPEQRQILEASGWQPYSIKIGDGYVSYQRLDPFATLLGTVADFYQYGKFAHPSEQEEGESIVAAILVSLGNNFTNKSYLTGFHNFVQALQDPERFMPTFMQRYSASLVPSALGQTTGALTDDYMRDVNGHVDGLMNKIPFYSDSVSPLRNVLGEPVRRRRSAGHDSIGSVMSLLLPVAYREVSDDQITRELGLLGHGFTPPRPVVGDYDLREFKGSGGQSAYDRWQELQGKVTIGGKSLRRSLGKLINSRRYQKMSPESDVGAPSPRISEIRKVIGQYRRKAWRQLLREFDEVKMADVRLKRMRREQRRANRTIAQMVEGN